MDDLKERIIVSYVTLTAFIPGLAYWMERNGAAYPGNPAWVFISTLRSVVLGVLAIVIGIGAFVGYLLLVTEKRTPAAGAIDLSAQFSYPPNRPHDPEAERKAIEEFEARRRLAAVHEEQARLDRQRIKAEQEHAVEEAKRRKAEEKRTRSFGAAIEAALEDF